MVFSFPPSLLLVAESAAEPISIQTALLLILGGALVFTIRALLALQRRVDSLAAAATPRKPKAASRTTAPLPPEILAVITAAAHDALGADHRIVAISAEMQNHTWSQEGRRQIFSSRKVR